MQYVRTDKVKSTMPLILSFVVISTGYIWASSSDNETDLRSSDIFLILKIRKVAYNYIKKLKIF